MIRVLTLLWKEVAAIPGTHRTLSSLTPPPYIKNTLLWSGRHLLFFWRKKKRRRRKDSKSKHACSLSHPSSPRQAAWSTMLALITISSSNWVIFHHVNARLKALYQSSYCFCTVLSLCYHSIALVGAFNARESPPLWLCYHLLFSKLALSYASREIQCEIPVKKKIAICKSNRMWRRKQRGEESHSLLMWDCWVLEGLHLFVSQCILPSCCTYCLQPSGSGGHLENWPCKHQLRRILIFFCIKHFFIKLEMYETCN